MPRPPRKPAFVMSAVTFIAGATTLAFLCWLAWLVTVIVLWGIPPPDRADFAATLVLAASGVLISAVIGARAAESPFEFLATIISTVKGVFRRW